jgi:hypothetical protein
MSPHDPARFITHLFICPEYPSPVSKSMLHHPPLRLFSRFYLTSLQLRQDYYVTFGATAPNGRLRTHSNHATIAYAHAVKSVIRRRTEQQLEDALRAQTQKRGQDRVEKSRGVGERVEKTPTRLPHPETHETTSRTSHFKKGRQVTQDRTGRASK